MKRDLYRKVNQFIINGYARMGREAGRHCSRTAHWIKQLRPDADDALIIAGLAHDIERALKGREKRIKQIKNKGFLDKKMLKEHQERSAEVIGEILKKEELDGRFIKRVKMLVSKHEEGGNEDQNLLKDADSLSFFENNIDRIVELIPEMGKEKVRRKIEWMYNRITSREAKKIAKPYYQKAIKKLKESQL